MLVVTIKVTIKNITKICMEKEKMGIKIVYFKVSTKYEKRQLWRN